MRKITTTLAILYALAFLSGCTPTDCRHDAFEARPGNKYARGFMLDDTLGCVRARVFAPWAPDSVMATYIVPPGGFRAIGCASVTHVGFMNELGLTERIVGMCDPQLVYGSLPQHCINLGNAMAPNPERVLQSGAEGMMISTYSPADPSAARMESVGITVFYNNEWCEKTPLARAEWIRFFGALFNVQHRADSVFNAVETAYNALKCPDTMTHKTRVMTGLDFRGTWYVPSGATYMAALFRDAGLEYAFACNQGNGSIPLTLEQALVTFNDCDIWVGCNAPSRAALKEMNEQYTLMRPYQTDRIYSFQLRVNAEGGNDFWESGVVHPEIILHDLITVSNPDSLCNGCYFINRL